MRFVIVTVATLLGTAAADAQAAPSAARFIERNQDWLVFVQEGAEKLCFAASAPKDVQPKAAKRGQIFFYLSTWATDGVRNEVSALQGYTVRADSAPTITVGTEEFQLYPRGDKVFIRDPAEERKLMAALEKAETMTIRATSARGTATIDSYSLSGLSASVATLQKQCP